MLGGIFALPVILSWTLYPSMAVHAVYDAVILAWVLPKHLQGARLPCPVHSRRRNKGSG
jgi:hypothetical protein